MRRASPSARIATFAILCAAACGPAPGPPQHPAATSPTSQASAGPSSKPVGDAEAPRETSSTVAFIKDDLAGALARAKAQGKLVFVDAWAPWCHTCLSMKNFVLNQPALKKFESDVVFVALDTEREENESFVERYRMDVWPTLFVIDPTRGELVGFWPGAASLREVEQLLSESVTLAELSRSGKLDPKSPDGLLLAAKRAMSNEKYKAASEHYGAAVRAATESWPRRNEALLGWIKSLHHARRGAECVEVGNRHADEVRGAAIPADFARFWFSCTRGLASPTAKSAARKKALAYLERITASPSKDASADDVSDAWEILADARLELGDKAGAKAAHAARLTLLEKAAAAAPTPSAAATFDYARAASYVALGRASEAVSMLEERVTQLPDSYEPSGRLASLLLRMGRFAEAKAAIDRTLEIAYGPRRQRYLALKAEICQKLGDQPGRIAALEEEVAEWRKLAKRQGRSPAGLRDAETRLAQARQGAR